MEIPELPEEIKKILQKHNAPERLHRHLRIVSFTAANLLAEITKAWSLLEVDIALVKFGALTHDIGKVLQQNEIYEGGKKHELLGEKLLIEYGFSKDASRFAYTHGNWKAEHTTLEDLLITLADKA